ncbi:M24 family metallopeptidase [Corynebacterium uterequi]|uniref:Xaa-Pro aminopeptidase n=1 Tax=Corynebacterium uterequi TaxID=1072256 RepID=A0A0G3HEQ4_9CORY|nr:Xaa-Pro peptidase family protein [Corynebacterium uterequi]AKK11200.1 Xaa-Pro aminopeptidase [Corynebacterium uterequi]
MQLDTSSPTHSDATRQGPDYQARRRRLAESLRERGLDAILITHLPNLRYLSGFSGSNAHLLVLADGSAAITTDGRYTTQIAQEVPDLAATIVRDGSATLIDKAKEAVSAGSVRIGVEDSHLSMAAFSALTSHVNGAELVAAGRLVEDLRLIKDADEINALRTVAAVANRAWATLLSEHAIKAGVTEREVAARLEYLMRIEGGERTSFDTIVASGPNSAKPHHGAEGRVLEQGDLVTVDFGAHLNGYNSDMTRTVVVGQADGFAAEIYDVVLRAQLAGIDAATVGTELTRVDAACRDIIAEAGYGEYFVHSTGHGVGLDVHEAPSAAQNGQGTLVENMTLTIEPGIYVPGRGGVRIEDTLLITADGPVLITDGDKNLLLV